MLKAIFWFVVGTAGTVLFAAVMLFAFGQTNRVVCQHPEPKLTNCSVSNVLLGRLPLPGWRLNSVVKAQVEEDCNDGCTYRTALVTGSGQSKPISEVWTDQEARDNRLAAQINAFIQAGDAPALVIDNQPAAWVIWLVASLTLMSIVIQSLVFAGQIARSIFSSRSPVGNALR